MPWFQVDDGFAFHHKAVKAGNAAIGLWTRAGSWCSQQLTDGHVPADMVAVLGTVAQARRLVRAGLWDEVDGGYQFHGWTEDGRNPTRQKVLEGRRRAADKRAKSRAVKSEEEQVKGSRPPETTDDVARGRTRGHEGRRVSPPLPSTPRELSDESSSPCSPPGTGAAARRATGDREPERFAEFWSAYPRRVGKRAAIRAWRTATELADPDTIIDGARRYAASRQGEDPKYTAHPSTWLNAGRWDDEPEPRYTPPPQRPAKDERIARLQALKAEFGEPADDESHNLRVLPGGVA